MNHLYQQLIMTRNNEMSLSLFELIDYRNIRLTCVGKDKEFPIMIINRIVLTYRYTDFIEDVIR